MKNMNQIKVRPCKKSISFRVPISLREKAEIRALELGLSLTEYIRYCVKMELNNG